MSPHPQILPTNERPLAENGNPYISICDLTRLRLFHEFSPPLQFIDQTQQLKTYRIQQHTTQLWYKVVARIFDKLCNCI